MKESDMLKTGSFYKIQRVLYERQTGKTTWLSDRSAFITINSDFLITIYQNSIVDVLIGVTADSQGKPIGIYLAEIELAK